MSIIPLERYAGYWSLIIFSLEHLALLVLLWKATGIAFFKTWLRRSCFLLPPLLYLAHLSHRTSLDPRAIKSFGDYNFFMTRLFVRDSEVLAARCLPCLSAILAAVSLAATSQIKAKGVFGRK